MSLPVFGVQVEICVLSFFFNAWAFLLDVSAILHLYPLNVLYYTMIGSFSLLYMQYRFIFKVSRRSTNENVCWCPFIYLYGILCQMEKRTWFHIFVWESDSWGHIRCCKAGYKPLVRGRAQFSLVSLFFTFGFTELST